MRTLNVAQNSKEAQAVLDTLQHRVVGQEEGIRMLVDIVESYQAGFSDPNRPAGIALFLGPTGSGKTFAVETLCKSLFGNEKACLRVDCAEFAHGHEIARLVGSPPGYLGHRETHPMFTQEALERYHTRNLKLSVVLFDEIEKASDTLWNLMLGILDKATLTLGDNRVVDFSKVIILMTSNLGSAQMEEAIEGGMGYNVPELSRTVTDDKIERIATEAAKRKFSPEFWNRLNHIAVFKTLTLEQIAKVLDLEIAALHERFLLNSKVNFYFHVRKAAKQVILKEGYNKTYNARYLQHVLERRVVTPLSRLIASGQVLKNDSVVIDSTPSGDFRFYVEDVHV